MSNIIEKAVILEEEANKLEELWYKYQAMNELIMAKVDNDMVFARFEKAYANYNKLWSGLLLKYFTKDYANMGGEYSWSANFSTKEIIITKN